jgi:hypothetical protein
MINRTLTAYTTGEPDLQITPDGKLDPLVTTLGLGVLLKGISHTQEHF